EGPLLLTREASDEGKDALHKNFDIIAKKKGYDPRKLKKLGSGFKGSAYEIDSQFVFKLTTDKSEAIASSAIMNKGKNLKHVVKVFDVYRLKDLPMPMYGIKLEKLQPLSEDEKDDLELVRIIRSKPAALKVAVKQGPEAVKAFINKEFEDDDPEDIIEIMEKYSLFEVMKELNSIGVTYIDYHEDNVMKRGSDFVMIDPGMSEIQGGTEPPVLEKCTIAFTNDIIESMGIKKSVREGGKAMNADRVPLANIQPTIDTFTDFALKGLQYKSVKPIGSTGKKSSSGDIDLGFDTEMSLDDIAAKMKAAGLEFKIHRGLGEVSVAFPQFSPEGKTDLTAQIDLMVGPEAWTQFQYYGPGDDSKYKGVYVKGIINGLLRVLGNYSVSPARGIFSKDDKEKNYLQDPEAVVRVINKKTTTPWTLQDLKQPFEKIWDKTKETVAPDDVEKIKEYFLNFMKSTKLPPPSELTEAPESKKRPKGIVHLEDMKPDEFMLWLKKYADTPLEGGLEISEKVDGSAFMLFGVENGKLWTQSKNGSKMFSSDAWPKKSWAEALTTAHKALESKADAITSAWPEGVSAFTSEILYTKIPNSVEYGPNVIMIHGVLSDTGQTLSPNDAKNFSEQIIKPTGGQLSSPGESWMFEYKPVIKPEDMMIDVKVEYDTLGAIYHDLKLAEPEKRKKAGREIYKVHLEDFKAIQIAVKKKLVKQLRGMKSVYGPEGGDIEGIVFRDLEDDSLVKLVDKEYFTKLNSFLWHYRKMLSAGVKIGDEWKTGVTQNLRDMIAKDVLGDKRASSTTFVKSMAKRANDVKFPETAKTSQTKVDYLLADYIQKDKLMQGDFLTKFSKALDASKEQFSSIKSEWDKEKTTDLTFTVKDDEGNPIKDIKMDPLVVKRTDESMEGMEEFFSTFDTAVAEVSSMGNDLTKKVALLKIMLGHKVEKLAGELDKMKNEGLGDDLFGGDSAPDTAGSKPLTDPGGMAGKEMDVNDPKNAEAVLKRFAVKLSKRPSLAGKNLDTPRELGAGSQGTAFDVGGKVLKITKDNKEAVASHKIMGDALKYVAKVEDVFRFPDIPIYGIVQERLNPLDKSDATNFNKLLVFTGLPVWLKSAATWDDAVDKAMSYVEKRKAKGDITSPEGKRMIQWADQFLDSLEQKYNVRASWEELKGKGITFSDYQADNLMKRGSEYVLIDIGLSNVAGGSEPPTLEGLRRVIQNEVKKAFFRKRPTGKNAGTVGRALNEGPALIDEDSRGKIRNLLKMPKRLADRMHALDPKNSFFLSQELMKWYQQLGDPGAWDKAKKDPFGIKKEPKYDTPVADPAWDAV
ncbi:MAG: hypothetical protein ACW99G_19665, partial [Candidatus Thorarchaeota archaeon]